MTFNQIGKKIPAPIDSISERELARTIGNALIVDFGAYTSRHKRVANAAGAGSEKTAANWVQGYNLPNLLYGLRLMSKSPTMAKEVLKLCALEADLSPEFQAGFVQLVQRLSSQSFQD